MTGRHWFVRIASAGPTLNGGLLTVPLLRDAAAAGTFENVPVFLGHTRESVTAAAQRIAGLADRDLAGTLVEYPPAAIAAAAVTARRADPPVGSVFDVRFSSRVGGLAGILSVESESVAEGLRRLWRIGRLSTGVGLSQCYYVSGLRYLASADTPRVMECPVRIDRVTSVDIVARPAADGRFLRPLD